MRRKIKNNLHTGAEYTQPQCEVLNLSTEGVLCASVDDLFEYDDEYEW